MPWLFALGLAWLVIRAWDNGTPHRQARREAARKRVPSAHRRRASTQANLGWWGSEALHGFPVTREGLAAGRDNWRHARLDHRRQRAARQAGQAIEQQGWRAEIASHLHRLEVASRDRTPDMTSQLRAAMRHRIAQLAGEQHGHDPDILPDGITPGTPREHDSGGNTIGPMRDRDLQTLRDKLTSNGGPVTTPHEINNRGLDGHNKQGGEPPGMGHGGSVSESGTGDVTFTTVNEACGAAIQEAEQAAGGLAMERCATIADELGAVIRDDSETMGKAHDLAAAARKLDQARNEVLDAAQALRERNQQAYGPHQEARDSTGVAPERQYTEA